LLQRVFGRFCREETIVRNAAIGQQLADDALDIVYQAEYLLKKHPGVTTNFPTSTGTCGTIVDDAINKILSINYDTGCVAAIGGIHRGKIMSRTAVPGRHYGRSPSRSISMWQLEKKWRAPQFHDFAILPDGAL